MSAFLKLLQQKKQEIGSRNRAKTAKIPDGTSRWRILSSWRGGEDAPFWHDFGQHFVKNIAGEMVAVYVCVDKTFARPCDICDAVSHGIKNSTDDATMKALTEARSNGRVLVNAIHLDGPKATEVQIMELPPTAFGMVIDIAAEWAEAGENIFDVVKGKDLVITRTGTGKNTKYGVQAGARTTAIAADSIKRLHNLDDYVKQESSEQQLRAMNAIRAATGALALAAPSGVGVGVGTGTPAGSVIVEDDAYAVATPPKRVVAAEVEDAKPVTRGAAKPVAAAPAPATGDDDLDEMLAALDAAG